MQSTSNAERLSSPLMKHPSPLFNNLRNHLLILTYWHTTKWQPIQNLSMSFYGRQQGRLPDSYKDMVKPQPRFPRANPSWHRLKFNGLYSERYFIRQASLYNYRLFCASKASTRLTPHNPFAAAQKAPEIDVAPNQHNFHSKEMRFSHSPGLHNPLCIKEAGKMEHI